MSTFFLAVADFTRQPRQDAIVQHHAYHTPPFQNKAPKVEALSWRGCGEKMWIYPSIIGRG